LVFWNECADLGSQLDSNPASQPLAMRNIHLHDGYLWLIAIAL